MPGQRNRALLLEALSDQLLRWGFTDIWRAVFLAGNTETVLFVHRPFTILCSDAPRGPDEGIDVLARRHDGAVQPARAMEIAVSFEQPDQALRLAVALQRSGGSRLRSALTTALCTAAVLGMEDGRRTLVLEPAVARAELEALATPPGSIRISAETYELVHQQIGIEVSTALVTREVHGEVPGAATLTLPPTGSSDLSTFAGLGLT